MWTCGVGLWYRDTMLWSYAASTKITAFSMKCFEVNRELYVPQRPKEGAVEPLGVELAKDREKSVFGKVALLERLSTSDIHLIMLHDPPGLVEHGC